MPVDEHTLTLDHTPVFYRASPTTAVTPVYLHGIPTSSDDWTALLERTGGIAPDLIGFGRSGKSGHLDYTVNGLAGFVEQLLDHLGVGRIALTGHDWGAAVAVTIAARRPEQVDRLVLIDAAPPLREVEWHRLARLWRRAAVGELVMGSIPKFLFDRELRRASADPSSWPDDRLRSVWEQFDQGTQRATLRLHRSADASLREQLRSAAAGLEIDALIMWGEGDPWLEPALAEDWATALPRGRTELVPGAGHWPWLEQPASAERIASFVLGT